MRQQLLDINLPPSFAYAEWVRHSGVEAAQNRLALWLVNGGRLWLNSQSPAGKTHIAHVLADEYPYLGFITVHPDAAQTATRQVAGWMEALSNAAWWLLDIPAGPVPRATGIALFHLLERSREAQRPIALIWRNDDFSDIPPELVTRLATLEQVAIHPPQGDAELTAVLQAVALSRQWQIDDAVIRLMLTHLPRDLDTLLSAMEQMENASLSERKRLTARWASRQIRDIGDDMAVARQSALFEDRVS
jgi:DnaA family protein